MSVITRINNLIDAHEGNYLKCKGCKQCKKIERLRSGLDREPAEKYADILAKGPNMTLSEIKRLVESEVQKKEIRKALEVNPEDFAEILKNLGLIRAKKAKEPEEMKEMALTKEKLEKHLAAGLSTKEIADKEKVTTATVYSLKSQYGLSKKRGEENPVEQLEVVKQEVKKAAAENPAVEQELRELIARLEDEVGEHKINEVFLNNTVKRLEEENELFAKEIVNLKASAEDTEREAYEAAMTIKRLESENKGLRESVSVEKSKNSELEMEIEKAYILRKALKAVL